MKVYIVFFYSYNSVGLATGYPACISAAHKTLESAKEAEKILAKGYPKDYFRSSILQLDVVE